MLEIILFAWVFGMGRGWQEINRGADIRVPVVFRFVIKYVTPVILIAVFFGSLLSKGGIIDTIMNGQLDTDLAVARRLGDLATVTALETKRQYVNGSRLLLVLVFGAIAYLVYRAQRKRG